MDTPSPSVSRPSSDHVDILLDPDGDWGGNMTYCVTQDTVRPSMVIGSSIIRVWMPFLLWAKVKPSICRIRRRVVRIRVTEASGINIGDWLYWTFQIQRRWCRYLKNLGFYSRDLFIEIIFSLLTTTILYSKVSNKRTVYAY